MGADTKIEWARHTHNPWIGCTAVSPACDNCYAEALGKRFGVAWGAGEPRRRTSEANRRKPFTWDRAAAKAGRVDSVFCASLADIWDNQAPIEWLVEELDTIRLTLHLRWLLLTKRPQMIRRRLEAALKLLSEGTDRDDLIAWLALWLSGNPPANVWLGTTVENQIEADRRIPHLLAAPAARRFLSCEPLLGPVDLSTIPYPDHWPRCDCMQSDPRVDPLQATIYCPGCCEGPEAFDGGVHWIIAGGESGPKARASHPDWFRSLRDQCVSAGVPFFFKQWGEWKPAPWKFVRSADSSDEAYMAWSDAHGATHALMHGGSHLNRLSHAPWSIERDHREPPHATGMHRPGKKAAGATLDGREWREVPGA